MFAILCGQFLAQTISRLYKLRHFSLGSPIVPLMTKMMQLPRSKLFLRSKNQKPLCNHNSAKASPLLRKKGTYWSSVNSHHQISIDKIINKAAPKSSTYVLKCPHHPSLPQCSSPEYTK